MRCVPTQFWPEAQNDPDTQDSMAASMSRRADVSVTLSNHFVRYVVLPWSDVVSDEDWQALAQHQFHIVYGDAAVEWVTTVAWQGPDQPVLACAAPRALVDMLHATVRTADGEGTEVVLSVRGR